jgi:hypothetical protein
MLNQPTSGALVLHVVVCRAEPLCAAIGAGAPIRTVLCCPLCSCGLAAGKRHLLPSAACRGAEPCRQLSTSWCAVFVAALLCPCCRTSSDGSSHVDAELVSLVPCPPSQVDATDVKHLWALSCAGATSGWQSTQRPLAPAPELQHAMPEKSSC